MSERTWEEEFAQRSSRAVAREICCSTCSSMRLPPLAQPWHWSRCICFAEGSRDPRARVRRVRLWPRRLLRTSAVGRDTTASLLSAAFCARDKIILLRKWAASSSRARFWDARSRKTAPINGGLEMFRALERPRSIVEFTTHHRTLCHLRETHSFLVPPLSLSPCKLILYKNISASCVNTGSLSYYHWRQLPVGLIASWIWQYESKTEIGDSRSASITSVMDCFISYWVDYIDFIFLLYIYLLQMEPTYIYIFRNNRLILLTNFLWRNLEMIFD